MSLHDYQASRGIGAMDVPFAALLMAAYRQADTANTAKIEAMWPELAQEFRQRYEAPGGLLPGEPGHDELMRARWNQPAVPGESP